MNQSVPHQLGIPFANRSHTSYVAAQQLRQSGGRREKTQRLLDAYQRAGEGGLTNLEASERTGLPLQSVCSMAHALQDCGLIVKGPIRTSRFGKPNQAWVPAGCST